MQTVLNITLHPQMTRGFTLIELMIVVVIMGVMLTIAVPSLREFVADQRVRTIASDLMGDMAFARAKALEKSRHVYLQKTGATWANGWRIYVDQDNSGGYDAGEEILKVYDGLSSSSSAYLCQTTAEFATQIGFHPDGRVVRNTPIAAHDGIYVADTLGDAVVSNNKIRGILLGLGRASLVNLNGQTPLCTAN